MRQPLPSLLLSHLVRRLVQPDRSRDERGDVPGWVMVTVMTAAVVAVLLPFVRDELQSMLAAAFDSVRG